MRRRTGINPWGALIVAAGMVLGVASIAGIALALWWLHPALLLLVGAWVAVYAAFWLVGAGLDRVR